MEKVVCFHNPDEANGYLSNWYLSSFYVDDIRFILAEQYMMYIKAMFFKDSMTAEKILITEDAAMIKALGRKVTPYDDKRWSARRYDLVYPGIREKFRQNKELTSKLLETGSAILAECAVRDTIWGIGLSMNDPRRLDLSRWKGQNLLGKALMQVREELRSYYIAKNSKN